MILPENRYPSPIAVEDMLFGIMRNRAESDELLHRTTARLVYSHEIFAAEKAMRLGYFTMPVHPIGRDWSQTLREDREAIILAEQVMPRVNAAIGKLGVNAAE